MELKGLKLSEKDLEKMTGQKSGTGAASLKKALADIVTESGTITSPVTKVAKQPAGSGMPADEKTSKKLDSINSTQQEILKVNKETNKLLKVFFEEQREFMQKLTVKDELKRDNIDVAGGKVGKLDGEEDGGGSPGDAASLGLLGPLAAIFAGAPEIMQPFKVITMLPKYLQTLAQGVMKIPGVATTVTTATSKMSSLADTALEKVGIKKPDVPEAPKPTGESPKVEQPRQPKGAVDTKTGKKIGGQYMTNADDVVKGTKEMADLAGKAGAVADVAGDATKAVTKSALKKIVVDVVGKKMVGSLLRKIPVIGAIAGMGSGLYRTLAEGDYVGGALNFGSGIAALLPGAGTAVSLGADVVDIARSVYMAAYGSKPEEDAIQFAKDGYNDPSIISQRLADISAMVTSSIDEWLAENKEKGAVDQAAGEQGIRNLSPPSTPPAPTEPTRTYDTSGSDPMGNVTGMDNATGAPEAPGISGGVVNMGAGAQLPSPGTVSGQAPISNTPKAPTPPTFNEMDRNSSGAFREFTDSGYGFTTNSAIEAYYAQRLNAQKELGYITEEEYAKGLENIAKNRDDRGMYSISKLSGDESVQDIIKGNVKPKSSSMQPTQKVSNQTLDNANQSPANQAPIIINKGGDTVNNVSNGGNSGGGGSVPSGVSTSTAPRSPWDTPLYGDGLLLGN